MSQVHFNKIVVIQSLGGNDLHTGTKLHEDIELHNLVHDRGLEIELRDISTREEFANIFKSLAKEAREKGTIPVLHIECHGRDDSEGLVLSSGEFIDWNELRDLATELNIATQLNLLLVLAACHGANFTPKLVPSERAPCWGLAGPKAAVSQDSILKSFSGFYQEILDSGSGPKAVEKLNAHSNPGDTEYFFTTAPIFFGITYNKYSTYQCSDEALGKRAIRMRKKLAEENISPLPSVAEIQLHLENTQEQYFEKYRTHFFMYDLYPDNEERFQVNYEDIEAL